MSYKKLIIWKLARENSIAIHKMSVTTLPPYELYETGSQVRRSVKSVRANIVEGYGRRRYKMDYVKFLIYALSSNDETLDHLETLFETNSLKDEKLFLKLKANVELLGKKLNLFIQSVEKNYIRR